MKFFQRIPISFLAKIHDLPVVCEITLYNRFSIHDVSGTTTQKFKAFVLIEFLSGNSVSIASVLARLFQWYIEVRFFYLVKSIVVRVLACWMENTKNRKKERERKRESQFRLIPMGRLLLSSDRSLRISRHARRKFNRTIRLTWPASRQKLLL